MKANYSYVTPFGDDLAIVTGKSAARGRDSVHNLRVERREMIKRLAALRALAERRWNDIKGLQATVDRLHDDAVENVRHFEMALDIAEKDKQSLLATVERLQAENARLQAESAKWRDTAERCFAAAMKNAVALANERKGERGA